MNVHLNNIITAQSSGRTGLQILVFKTSLKLKKDLLAVALLLDKHPGILRWNVDHHDTDNVLRIETFSLTPQHIESLVRSAGFCCEELPD
jgi:hypothetical protein